MAEHKAGAVLSGAIVTFAAALPLETDAQSGNVTLYGRLNMTMESIGSSPAFGVRETASGNSPVAWGDSHVHGHGWTVGAGSRLGVRGVEDLGGGLRPGFWFEGSGSNADSTSSGTVVPGTDRSRIWYLTPSPFGTNPASIGLGLTGLDSTVTTRVRNYNARVSYEWPAFVVSEPWSLSARPLLSLRYDRSKYDFTGNISSPTFGDALQSNTIVHMRDAYYGIGGGLEFGWTPGYKPRAPAPLGQLFPELFLLTDVAALRRDSSRHANQSNICAVPPCGTGENFSTAVDSLSNGWTYAARIRGEFRLVYKTAPGAAVFGTLAGGWSYMNEVSQFEMPPFPSSGPATFGVGSGYQRYLGVGLGFTAAF